MSKIAVIRTSPHKEGNSNLLVNEFIKEAQKNHEIKDIDLSFHKLNYCLGCYGTSNPKACTRTGTCFQNDDINSLCDTIRECDIIVFATPIYFYSMSGQMKVFLDRTVQLYGASYNYRDIYLIATSESGSKSAMDGVIKELEGWMACMPNTQLKGVIYGTNALAPGSIERNTNAIDEARKLGKEI